MLVLVHKELVLITIILAMPFTVKRCMWTLDLIFTTCGAVGSLHLLKGSQERRAKSNLRGLIKEPRGSS